MKHWPYLLTLLAALILFGSRWFSPSDLFDNDQPKTVAYTVDMVRHGHWLLPVDMLGRPATKPPMYNWLGAPIVAAGWHNEFALKLPSTLAALLTIVLIWHIARRAAENTLGPGGSLYREGDRPLAGAPIAVASIACICLMANYCIAKLCYTARPDMVLTVFTTAGWAAATSLLMRPSDTKDPSDDSDQNQRYTLGIQLVLWLCIAGAALAKGLPSLLLVIYVLIGAKLLGGRWSSLRRTGIAWGLPLSLGLIALWAYGAYTQNPDHFIRVFMGDETITRIGRGGFVRILGELWVMPVYFLVKFLPWSVFACLCAWHIFATQPRTKWFTGPTGAAMLWVGLVVVFFSCSGGKRADYIAPACPAGAVLASLWLVHQGPEALRLRPRQVALSGLAVVVLIACYELSGVAASNEAYGRNILTFVRRVRQQTHGQPIFFYRTGYTPIQALLGYNQPKTTSAASLDAPWLIKPFDEPDAVIVSDPIWVGGKTTESVMALYAVKSTRIGVPGTSTRKLRRLPPGPYQAIPH